MIYLDYNATTPLGAAATDAMRPFFEQAFGNPSSIHQAGRVSRAALDNARDQLAALLRAKPHEIIFTGGGTESDNLAVIGLARARAGMGRHLITSSTEHHAVLHAVEYLQKREGFSVTWLPVDARGRIDPARLLKAIRHDTTVVSNMSANNETGTLHPVREFAAICRERGVVFHTDAIQSFGKEPIDARDADAISLAAHKFHGPTGAGALYLREGIPIERLLHGGSHENERRPGTENVAALVGMVAAAVTVTRETEAERARLTTLRDRLWEGICTLFPAAIMNGDPHARLANTLNVSFPGWDAESLLINLDLAGICASSGSACMVGSIVPSHVLLAMGVSPELARGSVRFSLGKQTTREEVELTIQRMHEIFMRPARPRRDSLSVLDGS
jgi:cysteine desulfurase